MTLLRIAILFALVAMPGIALGQPVYGPPLPGSVDAADFGPRTIPDNERQTGNIMPEMDAVLNPVSVLDSVGRSLPGRPEGEAGISAAMSVVLLLGLLSVLGLDRALLYRIASAAPAPGVLKGTGLALRVSGASAGFAGIVAVLLWVFAPQIEGAGAPLGSAFWLAALAAATVPFALTRILASWMQANHRIAIGIIVPAISDAARAGLLGLVYLLGGGQAAVAGAVVASTALPT
ncbi:MAG: hypothetical protein AAF747_10460, partial [Planctomycetota bacterium]